MLTEAAKYVPRVARMMEGKGIDRSFREFAKSNWIFKPATKLGLIEVSSMTKGADVVGKGLFNRMWWDVTTEAEWGAHVEKYGTGRWGLFYR